MSVSRIEVSQGSVVQTDSAAIMPSMSHGRPPQPCTRSISATIQIVSADCSSNTGHRPNGTLAARIRP